MTFVIQLRGREWPESMGWQDTDFQPEDCPPSEWVAKMNDGDPQIEYRAVPVVGSDEVDQVKSLPLTYDEFRVLVRVLLRERDFQLPGALEVDCVTGVLTLVYLQSMLSKLGYGSDQVASV